MPGRSYLWTVGCQMNKADSEKLAAGFTRLGLKATDRMERADIVVLNTCSVRQHAEDRAYSKLGRVRDLKRERPELKVAVMGCMVGLKTDDLVKRFPQVDVFARPQQFEPIIELLDGPAEDRGGENVARRVAARDEVLRVALQGGDARIEAAIRSGGHRLLDPLRR